MTVDVSDDFVAVACEFDGFSVDGAVAEGRGPVLSNAQRLSFPERVRFCPLLYENTRVHGSIYGSSPSGEDLSPGTNVGDWIVI